MFEKQQRNWVTETSRSTISLKVLYGSTEMAIKWRHVYVIALRIFSLTFNPLVVNLGDH
jgi:hypothetical protein